MNGLIVLTLILGFVFAWILSYWYFSRKIRFQTKKMVQLMRADMQMLESAGHLFEDQDGQFFADLERASSHLRRKYLRLKKNVQDERAAHETMFSGLKEAVVTVDPDLHIVSFNSAFMQMFSWAPLSTSQTSVLQDVVRDPEVLKVFKESFSSKQKMNLDFGSYQLFVTVLPQVEDYDQWALGVFYDMSEIQKTEKIRVDFVANASHELRTPLTVIRGYSELLHNKLAKENSTLIELTKPIVESAHHMTMLLDDLLNLSKLDSQDRIVKSKHPLKELTEDVLRDLDAVISMNDKQIQCKYEADFVLADHSSLTQVLRNLIVNAIRYSGHDLPESDIIKVSWSHACTYDGKAVVELSVQDFGPGISKEHQERIFERFYRIDKGRDRKQGGTGLGLALVKHHVLIHGGSVKIESEPNQGCKFVCQFPE